MKKVGGWPRRLGWILPAAVFATVFLLVAGTVAAPAAGIRQAAAAVGSEECEGSNSLACQVFKECASMPNPILPIPSSQDCELIAGPIAQACDAAGSGCDTELVIYCSEFPNICAAVDESIAVCEIVLGEDADIPGGFCHFILQFLKPFLSRDGGTSPPLGENLAPTGVLSINDVVASEGSTGQDTKTLFTFTVSLAEPAASEVAVSYFASQGTADQGSDFDQVDGNLVFQPGDTQKPVSVRVSADQAPERDEFFSVYLTQNSNSVVAKAQGIGVVRDDDGGNVPPVVNVSDAGTAREGTGGTTEFSFRVRLSSPSGNQPVTVRYSTSNGTAESSDNDYEPQVDGTLSFGPGEIEKTIIVSVVTDSKWEYPEFFQVYIFNAINAVTAKSQAVGVIVNDD